MRCETRNNQINNEQPEASKSSLGVVAAVVIGVVILVVLIAAAVAAITIMRRRRRYIHPFISVVIHLLIFLNFFFQGEALHACPNAKSRKC